MKYLSHRTYAYAAERKVSRVRDAVTERGARCMPAQIDADTRQVGITINQEENRLTDLLRVSRSVDECYRKREFF